MNETDQQHRDRQAEFLEKRFGLRDLAAVMRIPREAIVTSAPAYIPKGGAQ